MTRLNQALRWWTKRGCKDLHSTEIPVRHFMVLISNDRLELTFATSKHAGRYRLKDASS